jgi:rubredoxin
MVALDIIQNKCPHCKEAKVFENSNLLAIKSINMNSKCSNCNYDFQKEVGFYWGAMFVSYGLATFEALIAYILCRMAGTETFDNLNLYVIIGTMIAFSPFNFRLSRLIWLYIFSKQAAY